MCATRIIYTRAEVLLYLVSRNPRATGTIISINQAPIINNASSGAILASVDLE